MSASASMPAGFREGPGSSPVRAVEETHHAGLWLIAAFKLLKGFLLLAVGFGALSLLHRDAAKVLAHWAAVVRVDPDNHFIHGLIGRLARIDDHTLKTISAGTFFYAALLLTEGVGLALEKRWAEYLTVIATSSLIPLEADELFRHRTVGRVVLIALNAAVVWYLVALLARQRRHRRTATTFSSLPLRPGTG